MASERNDAEERLAGGAWLALRTVAVVLSLYGPHVAVLVFGHPSGCESCRANFGAVLPVAPGIFPGAWLAAFVSRWMPGAWAGGLHGPLNTAVAAAFAVLLVAALVRVARRGPVALAWTATSALFVASAHAWLLSMLFEA